MKAEEWQLLIEEAREEGYRRGVNDGHRAGWVNGYHVALDSLRAARKKQGETATIAGLWEY